LFRRQVILAELVIVVINTWQQDTSRSALALLIHSYVFILAFVYRPASAEEQARGRFHAPFVWITPHEIHRGEG
jgi:hypothetical protein